MMQANVFFRFAGVRRRRLVGLCVCVCVLDCAFRRECATVLRRWFCFLGFAFLAGCGGGAGGASAIAPVPLPTGLSYTWSLGGSAPQTGPVDFVPWSGIWPNVTLGQASVVVNGAVLPLSISTQQSCVSVSLATNNTFSMTQGNNGSCVVIVRDAAGSLLPIIANSGMPGRPQLELDGAAVLSDGSFGLNLSANTTLTAFETLAGQNAGGPFTAALYGTCATVTPPQLPSSPAIFAFVPATPGTCFAVVGNGATQSLLVRISAQ